MPDAATTPPSPAPALGRSDQRLLRRIYQHPLSHNLSWRETLALVETLGSVEHGHDGTVTLNLGAGHLTVRAPHAKDLAAGDVIALRHLLTLAGWDPDAAPGPAAPLAPHPAAPLAPHPAAPLAPHPAAPLAGAGDDLAVAIDHAGARVFRLEPEGDGEGEGHAPQEIRHLRHGTEPGRRDAQGSHSSPADTRFLDAVAASLGGGGRIVVLGHGKGQGSEADHLMAHLARHHAVVHARVAREIVADLPHLTPPQLIALARHALQPVPPATASGMG